MRLIFGKRKTREHEYVRAHVEYGQWMERKSKGTLNEVKPNENAADKSSGRIRLNAKNKHR